jgi:hypothetical protein
MQEKHMRSREAAVEEIADLRWNIRQDREIGMFVLSGGQS